MTQDKKTSPHYNYVHKDEIWKDHVHHEMSSQLRKWPERWGFLVQEYHNMSRLLEGRSPIPVPKAADTSTGRCKLPPIKPLPRSRRSYPQTTAQEIGWVATDKPDHLGLSWAPRARGMGGIFKLLKWPSESGY